MSFDRIIDLIIIIFFLVPFLIVLLFLSILIIVIDRQTPLFTHERIGKKGKKFISFKLQTYVSPKTEEEKIVIDPKKAETRVTLLGRFLRDRGLDEIPQVFNILLGDMSLIGPRPLVEKTYEELEERYPDKLKDIISWKEKRLEVLPGLTGWHQIHLYDPNVIKYDLEYLENPSISKRLEIFIKSIAIMVLGKSRFFKVQMPTSNQYEVLC